MSRQKRTSKALKKAQARAEHLQSVDEQLDLGFGLTLGAFQAAMDSLQAHLKTYNDQLSALDAQAAALRAEEKNLLDLTERMLIGVGVKYGKDSLAYKQAGGVRSSERKKPTRKLKSGPNAPDLPENSAAPV